MHGVSGKPGCPSDETLAAFLDGALDETARRKVIRHLADCDECRAFAADWSAALSMEHKERFATGRVGVVKETTPPVEPAKAAERAEPSIRCAVCASDVGPSDAFCRKCGAPLKAGAMPPEKLDRSNLYETLTLILGIAAFIVSFFVAKFFWQFLIACGVFFGVYIYLRNKREVMIELIDALRSGDRAKEKEVIERLRRRFKA
jgi:hypothetical protein